MQDFEVGEILTVEPLSMPGHNRFKLYGAKWEVVQVKEDTIQIRAVDVDSDHPMVLRTIDKEDDVDFKIVSRSSMVRHVEP